jgi:hypothetical protein
VCDPKTSTALSMVFALFFATFNGVYPPLSSLGGGAWLWDLSFTRWAGEAIYTHYSAHFKEVAGDTIQGGANKIGYTIGRMGFDIAMVWVLGIVFRVLALIFFLMRKPFGRAEYVFPKEESGTTTLTLKVDTDGSSDEKKIPVNVAAAEVEL